MVNILLIVVAFLQSLPFTITDTAAVGCESLIYREGLRVRCTLTVQNSRSKTIDCHDRREKVPPGTIARYHCDTPFYIPLYQERSSGASADRERVLRCNSRDCGVPGASFLSTFIHGGKVTEQDDWPWHVALFKLEDLDVAGGGTNPQFKYFCGGSLIKPDDTREFVILTAAHCVEKGGNGVTMKVTDVRVVLGSDVSFLNAGSKIYSSSIRGDVYHVKEIIMHNSYDGHKSEYQSDIAILRLVEPVRLRANILPVCLSRWIAKPKVGDTGHFAGFGIYEKGSTQISSLLRRASIPVVDPGLCSEYRRRKLNAQELCAGTDNQQNACNGDSGGGLVFNATDENGRSRFYLHGIVSHGREFESSVPNCDTYTVYTRVSPFLDWIYEMTESFQDEEIVNVEPMSESVGLQLLIKSEQECGIPKGGFPPSLPEQGTRAVLEDTSDWPWQVEVFAKGIMGSKSNAFTHICSGSLISPPGVGDGLFVITAAKCVVDPHGEGTSVFNVSDILVAFGFTMLDLDGVHVRYLQSTKARFFPVKGIAAHKSFHETPDGNFPDDIALIRLFESAEQYPHMIPVCLGESHGGVLSAGLVGHLVGFGGENPLKPSRQLRRVSFPVTTAGTCSAVLDIMPYPLQFCAGLSGFKSTCYGDGGAGMVFDRTDDNGQKRFYLEGIASVGKTMGIGACEFSVFTRIGPYYDWIKETATKLLNS